MVKTYKIKLSDGTFLTVRGKGYKVWDDGDVTFDNDEGRQILTLSRKQWMFVADAAEVKV